MAYTSFICGVLGRTNRVRGRALPPRPLRLYRPARVARRRARYTHTHEVAEWRVYRSSVTLYLTYVRPALSEEFTLGYPPHVL